MAFAPSQRRSSFRATKLQTSNECSGNFADKIDKFKYSDIYLVAKQSKFIILQLEKLKMFQLVTKLRDYFNSW